MIYAHIPEGFVRDFKRQWPCSGLPSERVIFELTDDGNLVDCGDNVRDADGMAFSALIADFLKAEAKEQETRI